MTDFMKIGLVLGAGGVTGSAYLAGALAVIENDLGWDPRTADVIVGTSAGSLVGALLRSGVRAGELAAWSVGSPLADDASTLLRSREIPELDPVVPREFLRIPRRPHPSAILSAVRSFRRFDPARALMTHLADGERDLTPSVDFLGTPWPVDAFYCCAVRRRDGRRVVFGRAGSPTVSLSRAVAASCAVPGYFAPVEIAGHRYLDGGVASTTNADTLRDHQLDLVIAIAPMTTDAHLPRSSFERLIRRRVGQKLRAELAVLERDGVQTVTLAPGPEALAHLSGDFMSGEHTSDIIRASFFESGTQLRATPLAQLLDVSGGRAA
jgi:NTE family protein